MVESHSECVRLESPGGTSMHLDFMYTNNLASFVCPNLSALHNG